MACLAAAQEAHGRSEAHPRTALPRDSPRDSRSTGARETRRGAPPARCHEVAEPREAQGGDADRSGEAGGSAAEEDEQGHATRCQGGCEPQLPRRPGTAEGGSGGTARASAPADPYEYAPAQEGKGGRAAATARLARSDRKAGSGVQAHAAAGCGAHAGLLARLAHSMRQVRGFVTDLADRDLGRGECMA